MILETVALVANVCVGQAELQQRYLDPHSMTPIAHGSHPDPRVAASAVVFADSKGKKWIMAFVNKRSGLTCIVRSGSGYEVTPNPT